MKNRDSFGRFIKGHITSKVIKTKISNSLKGRFTGIDNPNWKGKVNKCIECGNILASIYAKRCRKCLTKEKAKCLGCNKEIRHGIKRCQPCHLKMLHSLNRTGDNSRINRKKGKCIDCKKVISTGAKRCQPCYSKSISGENSPFWKNKNKVYCIDCKKEINLSAKRCTNCYLKNNNPLYGRKGEKSYNWKGGITPLYELIRRLPEAYNWRNQVFIRDHYTCQKCFKIGISLEAHHKKSFGLILQEFLQCYSQFSPLEDKETLLRLAMTYEPFWDISNGVTLCKSCHNLTKKPLINNETKTL